MNLCFNSFVRARKRSTRFSTSKQINLKFLSQLDAKTKNFVILKIHVSFSITDKYYSEVS